MLNIILLVRKLLIFQTFVRVLVTNLFVVYVPSLLNYLSYILASFYPDFIYK